MRPQPQEPKESGFEEKGNWRREHSRVARVASGAGHTSTDREGLEASDRGGGREGLAQALVRPVGSAAQAQGRQLVVLYRRRRPKAARTPGSGRLRAPKPRPQPRPSRLRRGDRAGGALPLPLGPLAADGRARLKRPRRYARSPGCPAAPGPAPPRPSRKTPCGLAALGAAHGGRRLQERRRLRDRPPPANKTASYWRPLGVQQSRRGPRERVGAVVSRRLPPDREPRPPASEFRRGAARMAERGGQAGGQATRRPHRAGEPPQVRSEKGSERACD